MENAGKQCDRCLELKPITEFHRHRKTKDGRFNYCKKCASAAATKWAKEHPDRTKAMHKAYRERYPERHQEYRRKHYLANKPRLNAKRRQELLRDKGITAEQFDQMLTKQNGGCAICGSERGSPRWPTLHIDHDAETGAVRGLLCMECNTGIGKLKHNIDLLNKSIEYLRRTF